MIKWTQKDNKIFCKKDNKIFAFIEYNEKRGFCYAFGKPSQNSVYVAFEVDSIEKAKNRILEHI